LARAKNAADAEEAANRKGYGEFYRYPDCYLSVRSLSLSQSGMLVGEILLLAVLRTNNEEVNYGKIDKCLPNS